MVDEGEESVVGGEVYRSDVGYAGIGGNERGDRRGDLLKIRMVV